MNGFKQERFNASQKSKIVIPVISLSPLIHGDNRKSKIQELIDRDFLLQHAWYKKSK